MEKSETVSVILAPHIAAQVQQAIADGEYRSTHEVIEDALRSWGHERELNDRGLNYLQTKWLEAEKDRRPGLTPEPVFARVKERFSARSKVNQR